MPFTSSPCMPPISSSVGPGTAERSTCTGTSITVPEGSFEITSRVSTCSPG